MTDLHQEAIEIIQGIPDEEILFFVGILKNASGLINKQKRGAGGRPDRSMAAYNRLLRFKGTLNFDIDPKAELSQARDEKYADFI